MSILEVNHSKIIYKHTYGRSRIEIFHFSVEPGEFVASWRRIEESGKTTLLITYEALIHRPEKIAGGWKRFHHIRNQAFLIFEEAISDSSFRIFQSPG